MKLSQYISRTIFRLHGWRLVGKEIPKEVSKCVFVFAPHTSNWDFYHGLLCMKGWGVPIKVAIKSSWTRFPLGLMIRPLGGIGVDRSANKFSNVKSQVNMMASVFQKYERIALVVTPEGSRSKRTQWKTGFYHIAKSAGVPIVIFKGDFSKKEIEFGPVFSGEESLDEVMRSMMEFFKDVVGRHPENFALDVRYSGNK